MSSQASGANHVSPLAFSGEPARALQRLTKILGSMPRTRIVSETSDYLRAESASRVFGFVDDIEFLLDPKSGIMHVRSASRLGYSDFGVNRRRVEAIRAAFDGAAAAP